MKRMNVLVLLISIGHTLLAQRATIIERAVTIKGKPVNAWVVPVGDNPEVAKKAFTSFVKKELRLKPASKGKRMIVSKKVNLPVVSTSRGDLKGILFSEYDNYKMGVAFVLGHDIALNSRQYPVEMRGLRDITIDYLKYFHTRLYDDALEIHETQKLKLEKRVAKMEKEINSLVAANQRIERKKYKTEDAVAKLKLRNEIMANDQKRKNLNIQLLELNQEIVRKHFAVNKIREDYIEVMAQIQALRTTEKPQV